MKRELNWGEPGDGQCKNDTFAMEGLCSLIFKAIWNKQYMQAFAAVVFGWSFFGGLFFRKQWIFVIDSSFCGFLLALGADVDAV